MSRRLLPLSLLALCAACGQPAGNDNRGATDPLDAAAPDAATPGSDVTPDSTPDSGAPASLDLSLLPIAVGGEARVIAAGLNLRSGAGTSNPVLTVMACGDQVKVVGGPSGGWWNVTWQGTTGWASGEYLVAEDNFDPAVCSLPDAGAAIPDGGLSLDQASIFARAKLAVGYSYYWGHGSWRADQTQLGACMGTCSACTHTGAYGADCSGFVAKCWQIPSASPITTDLHPYSTYDFYNSTTHWAPLPRTSIQPADALVYNANGEGHIMLFESGADPWGNIWTYEARGCSTGIVHNLRVADATYITIRKN